MTLGDSAVALSSALGGDAQPVSKVWVETVGDGFIVVLAEKFEDSGLRAVSADKASVLAFDQDCAREVVDVRRGSLPVLADLVGAVDDGGEPLLAFFVDQGELLVICLLYTSPSPRDS